MSRVLSHPVPGTVQVISLNVLARWKLAYNFIYFKVIDVYIGRPSRTEILICFLLFWDCVSPSSCNLFIIFLFIRRYISVGGIGSVTLLTLADLSACSLSGIPKYVGHHTMDTYLPSSRIILYIRLIVRLSSGLDRLLLTNEDKES
jgi:hypothetical protein